MPVSEAQKIVIFDIGSNSIKCLVAQTHPSQPFQVLFEETQQTRLSEGIHHHFQLSENAIERTLLTLEEFRKKCEKFEPHQWHAVATSAVRDAGNRREFEKKFSRQMGFLLRVLSGEEEAQLIFKGVISDQETTNENLSLLVMDVGGGSAEWIRGNHSKIQAHQSLDLGCVRMTERFLRGDPYTEESFNTLCAYYQEQLSDLETQFKIKTGKMIGTGGTIVTSAALLNPHQLHGVKIQFKDLESLLIKLRTLTQSDRLQLKSLPPKRSDIIVAGIALYIVAMRAFHFREIIISTRGLKYGVLLEAISPKLLRRASGQN